MNISFKQIVINFALILSVVSGIAIGFKIDPELVNKALGGDFSGVIRVGFITIGFMFIVAVLAVISSRKSSRVADSRLLKPIDLKGEQKYMRNEGIYHVKPKFKNKKQGFYADKSALQLSSHVKLSTKASYTHTIVFGPTGSGKSAAFFIPILRNIDGNSIIVTDPKGELHAKTKDYLAFHGYDVLHLNFNDPTQSDYYSLLGSCNDHSEVNKLAESIMGQGTSGSDENWAKMSKPLFASFLFHEFDKGKKSMSNVIKHMSSVGADVNLLDAFFANSSPKAQEMYQMFKGSMGSEATVGSIITTINGKIEVFTYDKVQRLSNRSSFSADNFRLKKSALFVSYPEDEAIVYAPYIASFFYQIMSSIKAHPSMYEGRGGKKGNGVHFLLDEFANIGTLPELDTFLSTIRSKEMSVMLGIQSFDQIKVRYKERTNTIVENCKTKIVLPGTTGETAKFFSELVGEEEHKQISVSSSKGRDASMSQSEQKKMILSQDQIRRLKSHEVIFVSDNLKPCKDIKNMYFLTPSEQRIVASLPFSSKLNSKIAKFVADKLKLNDEFNKNEAAVKRFAKKRTQKVEDISITNEIRRSKSNIDFKKVEEPVEIVKKPIDEWMDEPITEDVIEENEDIEVEEVVEKPKQVFKTPVSVKDFLLDDDDDDDDEFFDVPDGKEIKEEVKNNDEDFIIEEIEIPEIDDDDELDLILNATKRK